MATKKPRARQDDLKRPTELLIGCAGWSLRKDQLELFPQGTSHLQRYAEVFNAVEINSSFYRSHRPGTYERWAAATPDNFRFAVKVPKQITHVCRLVDTQAAFETFLLEVAGLKEKLGPILIQLPPSLVFDAAIARQFFYSVRQLFAGDVGCEPRHPTWFSAEADEMLNEHAIARAAADPAMLPEAAVPGGASHIRYFRWHGSPRMYYSSYEEGRLRELAAQWQKARVENIDLWCIFDNTAAGAAVHNALMLSQLCASDKSDRVDACCNSR